MNSPAKQSPPNISTKKRGRLLARLIVTLLSAFFLLLIAAPFAIKVSLQQWLSEQTQSEVTVAEIRFNLFSGTLQLRKLQIPHAQTSDAVAATSLEYARVTIDMVALFRQEIIIEELLLSHANIAINRKDQQLRVAGISVLSNTERPSEAAPKPASTATDAHSQNNLGITVKSIVLESVTLSYHSNKTDADIVIDSAIKNITTDHSGEAMQIALNIAMDKGNIAYQGELSDFSDQPTFSGELTIADFNLATFAPLIPLDDFTVRRLILSHHSTLNGTLPQAGSAEINLIGNTTLSEIDIVSMRHDDTFLKSKSIEFNKLNLQYPTAITINEVVINGLDSALFKDREGLIFSAQKTASVQTATSTIKDNKAASSTPLAFTIGNVIIKGDSAFAFRDASVTPEFDIKLHPLALTIGRIASNQPTAETPISLDANLNKTGTIKLNGTFSPLAKEMKVALNSSLNDLELPLLSPYTEKQIGYQLRRGRLSAETTLNIQGDQLRVNNRLSLAKLSIKESDHEKAQGLIEALEMPLDSALDLLRDRNDNIVFDLPIDGSLDDPHFKLSGVMRLAIGKGMKMAAMNYLTNALQPLGTILLAKDIFGMVTKPRFKPLTFNPGEAELSANNIAYLEKLGTLLKKRPKLTIALCGVATGDDIAALATKEGKEKSTSEAMYALAKARANNSRTHLANQHKITASQLFECNPTVTQNQDESENLVEGVEITL